MWRKKEVYLQVLWCLNITVSMFSCFLKMLKPIFSLYYCRMSKMDLWFIYVKKLYSTKLSLLSAAEMGFFTKIIYYWTKVDLQICYLKKNPRMIKEKSKNQVSGIQSLLGILPSLWQACHTCRCISNGTQCVKAI